LTTTTTRTTTSGNSVRTRRRYTCAPPPRHRTAAKSTHTHTHFIRLFYYTPTIKQSNEIIIMCVRFPGGGGSVVIFFYNHFSKLSLCHRYNRNTSAFLLFIGIWSNVIDRIPLWKSVSEVGIVALPLPPERYDDFHR